jgi:hypothetical protein
MFGGNFTGPFTGVAEYIQLSGVASEGELKITLNSAANCELLLSPVR